MRVVNKVQRAVLGLGAVLVTVAWLFPDARVILPGPQIVPGLEVELGRRWRFSRVGESDPDVPETSFSLYKTLHRISESEGAEAPPLPIRTDPAREAADILTIMAFSGLLFFAVGGRPRRRSDE